ncbi:hypothetical protein [Helicobacter zhangjianzhongii]|uniref:Uncharacterized protein n=1 Tax=Helicobacter zhangjianzhongii TaxID=2974574 RepID=A0ACC6FS26_9HELI|nr:MULTISPECIES: hypothetical protein [unclassified Helicobacter]MDL0079873.1 hypothetical protein [Helicobacter sp. CPD2-1]MDL0082031.1 hypothetical protein [Helicobacter sp. XJK30-2]
MAYCSLVKVDSRLGAAWRWCFARRALAWRMDTKEAALCHADKSARNDKKGSQVSQRQKTQKVDSSLKQCSKVNLG